MKVRDRLYSILHIKCLLKTLYLFFRHNNNFVVNFDLSAHASLNIRFRCHYFLIDAWSPAVVYISILKASKNATVTIWPRPIFNAVEALLSNKSITL